MCVYLCPNVKNQGAMQKLLCNQHNSKMLARIQYIENKNVAANGYCGRCKIVNDDLQY